MEKSILNIVNLSHRYTTQWAVKDLNFKIEKNGIYGLLGSNGAGKSTAINIVCGVVRQTSGEVYINGINTLKDPVESRKCIGFLPQKPPLYLDLTVEEFLLYAARIRRVPEGKCLAAVEMAIARCGIEKFRQRLIRNLSGGYQQRVGIAQAIIHSPSIVIFDEPTNGLDPNQVLEIRHLIKEIATSCTVLLSTHLLSEVHAMCDSILMIEQGEIVFSGDTVEFDNYIQPNTFEVSMAAPPSIHVLKEIEGVLGIDELGGNTYRVQFDDADLVMERFVNMGIENSWHLKSIKLDKISLDTIFAELSKKKK